MKVLIENKPSYFGSLELREIPADTGKDMLEPASLSVDSNNIAVFPDPDREYYFDLAPNAGRGQFVFKLYNKDGTQFLLDSATADIRNDYLDFTCQHSSTVIGKCEGSLELLSANGELLYGATARSGVGDIFNPYLPNYRYYIDIIGRRNPSYFDLIGIDVNTRASYCFWNHDKDKGCKFCDLYGNCWYAHFQPDPIYDTNAYDVNTGQKGRYREELGLHPGRNVWTLGCIGIDRARDSGWLYDKINRYLEKYERLDVNVHE